MSTPERVKPYETGGSKAIQVEEMFDSIAPAYDFMNTAMTFGLHRSWREKMLSLAKKIKPDASDIIDLATGTGDVALALTEKFPKARIIGSDLSKGMLALAEKKLAACKDLAGRIKFETGDCLNLGYDSDSFDLLTIAYGVRNFENLMIGFQEMQRILRHGGSAVILELSRPENSVIRLGYDIYSRNIIPFVGRLVSKDPRAYSYLPESIAAMPSRKEIVKMLLQAGFRKAEYKSLTLGVVTIYIATK